MMSRRRESVTNVTCTRYNEIGYKKLNQKPQVITSGEGQSYTPMPIWLFPNVIYTGSMISTGSSDMH